MTVHNEAVNKSLDKLTKDVQNFIRGNQKYDALKELTSIPWNSNKTAMSRTAAITPSKTPEQKPNLNEY